MIPTPTTGLVSLCWLNFGGGPAPSERFVSVKAYSASAFACQALFSPRRWSITSCRGRVPKNAGGMSARCNVLQRLPIGDQDRAR